jgi:hypothetical protein
MEQNDGWHIIIIVVSIVAGGSTFAGIFVVIKLKLQKLRSYSTLTDTQDVELSPMFASDDEDDLSGLW